MADPFEVDNAVVNKLLADPQLQTIVPDGIWFGEAGVGLQRFVVVRQAGHTVEYQFGSIAWEIFQYDIEAVILNTTGGDSKGAAARIHALLQNGSLTLTGWAQMLMRQVPSGGRVRQPELDLTNAERRWLYSGGRYEVWVIPLDGN